MRPLDFLIIGAQKCATTTLFELLRQHPDISMPLEKEVPFFTDEDCSTEAWSRFSDRYLGNADARLRGKASPQYMADPDVPARIAALMPDIRLIAVLRDPIERSRSQLRMGLRRHTETRDFETAMRDSLQPAALAAGRRGHAPTHADGWESEADFYLAWSEYGRILGNYRRHFPARQLLVLYTEDLEKDPGGVLQRVLDFLGLAGEFRPRGLGEVMHAGGTGERIPHGLRVWLRERALVNALWQQVPAQQQGRLRFLYERWNSRKTRDRLPLSPATEQALREHFGRDLIRLSALGAPRPPWASAYLQQEAYRIAEAIG